MAEVIQDAQHEFWRPPSALDPSAHADTPSSETREMAEVCPGCGSEFMIGARFCHSCGTIRPAVSQARTAPASDAAVLAGMWAKNMAGVGTIAVSAAAALRKIPLPGWLHYLHFHEIKRWVGLPTAALIAFMIGLGCVAGALGVSFFYKASNLAEFQAIQMWRIEWLLAATASFAAGILLKRPSGN
jgi:hypothetical protein